jgi:hypothetical protein
MQVYNTVKGGAAAPWLNRRRQERPIILTARRCIIAYSRVDGGSGIDSRLLPLMKHVSRQPGKSSKVFKMNCLCGRSGLLLGEPPHLGFTIGSESAPQVPYGYGLPPN